MLKFLVTSLIGIALFAPVSASLGADSKGAADTPATAADTEKALAEYRNQMQASRADIMAKALTLSADEASKFWPLFEKYQKEQNVVIDAQIRAIQAYASKYDKLSGNDAVAFVKALLDRDGKMQELRVKWLQNFQTVLPPSTAARVIQVDRRLSQLAQANLSAQIPLVH